MPRQRIAVREVPCAECGEVFGQTANEIRKGVKACPKCHKIWRDAHYTGEKKQPPKNYLEIVLPWSRKPSLDRKRGEWFINVRVRKRHTDEEYQRDKIWLGVKAEDDPEQAFLTAYARLEMNGATRHTKEIIAKKRRRIYRIRNDIKSWKQGRDRDLGVFRTVIKKVVYKVFLPDPLEDKKRIYVGTYNGLKEARVARNEHYKQIQHTYVPCDICGRMPAMKKTSVSHFASDCPNKVAMPMGVRPLLQAKLWNLIFSKGDIRNTSKLTLEELARMGFFFRRHAGFRFHPIREVEYDFSLAKKHAAKFKARPGDKFTSEVDEADEDDAMFE